MWHLRFLASGSEYCVYHVVGQTDVTEADRVMKVPLPLSWRLLTQHDALSVRADIELLEHFGVAFLPTEVWHGPVSYLLDGDRCEASFALVQKKVQMQIVLQSELADPGIRRQVAELLLHSMQMVSHARAIDFTGMDALFDLLRGVCSGKKIVGKLYNLHNEDGEILLVDVGLLPLDAWFPVRVFTWVEYRIQHALIRLAIEEHLSEFERRMPLFEKAVLAPLHPTAGLIPRLFVAAAKFMLRFVED